MRVLTLEEALGVIADLSAYLDEQIKASSRDPWAATAYGQIKMWLRYRTEKRCTECNQLLPQKGGNR